MSKVLFILMPKDYRDEEFVHPHEILKEKGHEITVASFAPGIAIGAGGYQFPIDMVVDDLTDTNLNGYDAVVIPGGPGSTTYLWGNDALHKIIKQFHKNKKPVCAICYAVIPVVETGILQGKTATVYPTDEAKDIFKKHNVTFLQDGCVVLDDEKIITAQGPAQAKEFGHAIADMLEK